ncbi:hypothetical protein HDU87_007794 [Geranomyces variabilis]|uniref:Uncharacterized protein n=1 Tax=Geranomyces variabilis TaxID=109894 RepID=A0AAD5TJ02_9FUNG|nr:hypothetical protein HDU87_007794 [Geranomyces variabilis]
MGQQAPSAKWWESPYIPLVSKGASPQSLNWSEWVTQLFAWSELRKAQRPAAYASHVGVTSQASAYEGRCPNISYLTNPFDAPRIHNILKKLDSGKFNWEGIAEHLRTGVSLFSSNTAPSTADEGDLEAFLLSAIYLNCFGHSLTDVGSAKSAFEPILHLITSKTIHVRSGATFSRDTWFHIFTSKNLRFKTGADRSITPSHVFLNEILEAIRIRALPDFGTNGSVDDLARYLPINVFTILEFADTSLFITAENMKILARYSGQLPKSWFMLDLLKACMNLGLLAEAISDGSGLLSSSLQLLAAWLRKAGPADNATIANNAIGLADRTIRRASRGEKVEEGSVVASLVTLGCSIGALDIDTDLAALESLCIGLPRVNLLGETGRKAVYSQLAILMKTLPPAPLKIVSTALLQAHDLTHGLEAHIRLMYFYEYIALAGYDSETFAAGGATPKRAKWWAFWRSSTVPEGDAFAYLEAIFASIDELWAMDNSNFERRIAENNEQSLKVSEKMIAIENQLRNALLVRLSDLAASIASESQSAVGDATCQIITFASAQLLVSPSEQELIAFELDWQPVLSVLTEVLFTHSEALYVEDDFFARVAEEFFDTERDPSGDKSLQNRLHAKVSKGTQHPLYMEIGKIARIVGSLLAVQWTKGNYEGVSVILQRVSAFCENTHESWNSIEHPVPESPKNQFSAEVWQYLKTVLFVTTAITHTFVDVLLAVEPPLATRGSETARLSYDQHAAAAVSAALEAFSSLHFVTARFGLSGFKTWHDSLQGLAVWIEERDAERQGQGRSVDEMLEAGAPTYRGIFVHPNPLVKTRLMFYLIFARLLLRSLSPSYVADEVLPRLYPYLTYNVAVPNYVLTVEDKDLFELSHAVSVTLFEHAGKFASLVAEFAGWYATMLIEITYAAKTFASIAHLALCLQRFPDPIDFDLFRQSFSTMIKSLSTIKPSRSANEDKADAYEDDLEDADEYQKPARSSRSGRETDHSEDMLHTTTRRGERNAGLAATSDLDADVAPDMMRAERTEEGDFIAWMCIARLADAIHRLSIQIDAGGKTPPAGDHSPLPPPQSRLERILAASPTTALVTRRDQIAMVLFDQIATVGLAGLEPLLATVRHVMLGGPVGYSVPFARDDNEYDAAEIGLVETLARVPGIGTQTNPDRSRLWQSLFDAVGHYRGFDYTRRERCAQWYLATLRDARLGWKGRSPPDPTAEAALPVHPELRAKL